MSRELPQTKSNKLEEYGLNASLPPIMDASRLKTFVECPSKFYHQHVLGLVPRATREQRALTWGSMWHLLMWNFNHDRDVPSTLVLLDEKWPEDVDPDDRHNRTKPRMRELFLAYVEHYIDLDRREWENLRREQFFELECPPNNEDCPFGGCGLQWSGRIDGIKKRVPRNSYVVWDYKTTSYLRGHYFDGLKHGFQMPGYAWAARHMLPTNNVKVVIDLLHTLSSKHNFVRQTLTIPDPAIIEWRENVKGYLREIERLWEQYPHEPRAWAKNWQACYNWNRPCPFWSLHSTLDIRNTRLRLMEQEYMEDRWDPAELLEEV